MLFVMAVRASLLSSFLLQNSQDVLLCNNSFYNRVNFLIGLIVFDTDLVNSGNDNNIHNNQKT